MFKGIWPFFLPHICTPVKMEAMAGQFDVPSHWCAKIFHNFSTTFNCFASMKGWIFECKIKGIKKMQINVRCRLCIYLQRAMILTTAYRYETEVK